MKKEPVNTPSAPTAVGPYSHALKAGNLLYLSGQLPIDPKTEKVVSGGIEAETHQVLSNIKGILIDCGLRVENLIRVEIFLTDLGDFDKVNELYSAFLEDSHPPVRQTVQVAKLPKDVRVEISCIATY